MSFKLIFQIAECLPSIKSKGVQVQGSGSNSLAQEYSGEPANPRVQVCVEPAVSIGPSYHGWKVEEQTAQSAGSEVINEMQAKGLIS